MAEITGVGDGSYDFRAGRLCNSREWFAGLHWARSFDSMDGGFLSSSHTLTLRFFASRVKHGVWNIEGITCIRSLDRYIDIITNCK